MDKNDVLKIYDEDYTKGYEYKDQLKISVNKGVDFLLNNQFNYGEFKTEICKRYKDSSGQVVEEWNFDSSPFATALILYSLNFLEEDERVQKLREHGLKFLMAEMEEGGLWRYCSSKNRNHFMLPPDLDDTCCISYILKINQVLSQKNIKTILNNQNQQGIFYSWMFAASEKRIYCSNETWNVNQENDICCVVNSNVLLYLGETEQTRKVVEYLIQVVLKDRENISTPFYNHKISFYYMLSRAYYNGALTLVITKKNIIDKILNIQQPNGSFGNELLTSLSVCSLLNYGYCSPDLNKAINFLVKNQQADGSWKRIPMYGYHTDKATYGSAELTTAFCLEALARYQLLDATAEHKEKQEETVKVIVKSPKTQGINRKKLFLLFFIIIRSDNWWLYKIPPLLAIAYAEILLMDLPVIQSILTVLALLLSISSLAAYGHIVNDIFDIEVDQRVGKNNSMAQFSSWQCLLLCILFAATGFVLPILMNFGTWAIILLGINYLLPTLYSAPPLRLKEKGIWGVVSDAAGAHAIPTLFFAATFLHLSTTPQPESIILTITATVWSFCAGIRGILLHQLWDRENDLKSGVKTLVTSLDIEKVRFWISYIIFPIEISLLSLLVLVISRFAPILLVLFILYLLLKTINIKLALANAFEPAPTWKANVALHDFYEVCLPLALITLLSIREPLFLILLLLHIILFYPSIKQRTTDLVQLIVSGLKGLTNLVKFTNEYEQKVDFLPTNQQNQQELEKLQVQLHTSQTEFTKLNSHLQTQEQLEQIQAQLQQTQGELQQSQSQLHTSQTELVQSQSDLQQTQEQSEQIQAQLRQTEKELAESQSQLHTSQTESVQLKSYLQQTQGVEGVMSYYRSRIASNPDDIQLYHQALEVIPDDAQIHLQLGNALVRQNRLSDAIATYQTVLQFHPDNFEIHLELAKALEKEKKWDEAIAFYQRAIELNPDYSWSHKHLGDILAERGQLSGASLSYRRALQLQPRIF